MATIQASQIPKTNIKFRWSEPFASEGANVQMAVVPPGAYRGGLVRANPSSANKTIWIMREDGDTAILHRDSGSGACTTIRMPSDVQIDLQSQFSSGGAIPAGGKKLYVYAVVSYAQNVETSGEFRVDDVEPDAGVGVRLAMLDLPAGATEVKDEYIRTDGDHRDKVPAKRLIPVVRRVLVPAQAGRTRFQIVDKACFLGPASEDWNVNKVRLGYSDPGNGGYFRPMVDPVGGLVTAGNWYPTSTSTTALTISDMDDDGCYKDPWVALSFDGSVTSFDGEFWVSYYAAVEFDKADIADFTSGFVSDHTANIYGRDESGSPDILSKGALATQLATLLGLVNGRIRTNHPAASSTNYTLLWRNNTKTDSQVDIKTTSVYFNQNGIALVKGGYLTTDGKVKTNSSFSGTVSVLSGDPSGWGTAKADVSGARTLSLGNAADWDLFQLDAPSASWLSGGNASETLDQHIWDGFASAVFAGKADSSPFEKYVELFRSSHADMNVGVYIGKATLCISYNARWSGSLWIPMNDEKVAADMIKVSSGGVHLLHKRSDDSDWETGWEDDIEAGWTSGFDLFNAGTSNEGSSWLGMNSFGRLYCVAHAAFNIMGNVRTLWGDDKYSYQVVPLPSRIDTPLTSDQVSITAVKGDISYMTVSFDSAYNDCVVLKGKLKESAVAKSVEVLNAIHGSADRFSLNVSSTSRLNIFPGDIVYVEGFANSSNNGAFTVIDRGFVLGIWCIEVQETLIDETGVDVTMKYLGDNRNRQFSAVYSVGVNTAE